MGGFGEFVNFNVPVYRLSYKSNDALYRNHIEDNGIINKVGNHCVLSKL
jgi:hypothetical protein